MLYAEAFKKLGYTLDNKRQDWSAEKPDGICLSVWRQEATWMPSPPHVDFWALHPQGGDWMTKPGHIKRTQHIARAMAEFDGLVDIVMVSGTPGEGAGDSDPWLPTQRSNHVWRVTRFDPESGLFRAEAQPIKKAH